MLYDSKKSYMVGYIFDDYFEYVYTKSFGEG